MFYTTLAPNLQTNWQRWLLCWLQRQRHSCNNNNNSTTYCNLRFSDANVDVDRPPYSVETTHDLSTTLSLLRFCCCSLLFLCSLTHTHTHRAKAAAFHFCFVFILFILAIWHFAFFECVREWEREKKRESGRGRKSCICNLHFALHKIV